MEPPFITLHGRDSQHDTRNDSFAMGKKGKSFPHTTLNLGFKRIELDLRTAGK